MRLPWPWRRDRASGPDHLRAGAWGEAQAEKHLRKQGFRILGRRVRVGRKDEIDLIARDGEVLVFVEVKTRRSEAFGRPVEAVRRDKQAHLSRAAMRHLRTLRPRPDHFRFDVVEVVGSPDTGLTDLRHLPDAFPLHPAYRVRW